MCASTGAGSSRRPAGRVKKARPYRRASQYTAAPPATLALHVSPKTTPAWSVPRPARNAPRATVLSAGTTGKTFSNAASTPISVYKRPGGRSWRKARRSVRRGLRQQRHGDHRDPLAPPDPSHALVGLGFDGHGREARHQRAGESLAHVVDIGREAGPLRDHGDVRADEAQACFHHPQIGALEQIE